MKKSVILVVALLAACALTPQDTGKAFLFALPPVGVVSQHEVSGDSLIVALPVAAAELDTYRIALMRREGRWDYYAGARWAEFLPLLVQDSLARTLEDSGLFSGVATDREGLSGDLVLKTEISAFQAEYSGAGSAPVIRVKIFVSLLNRLKRVPVVSFSVQAEEKAAADSLPAIQAAFAAASGMAQKQIVRKLKLFYESSLEKHHVLKNKDL